MFNIALGDWGGGNTAAIGTGGAIGVFFNILGNNLQAPFNEVMPLHPGTKPEVFLALLLTKPLDLHEVSNHTSMIMEG